MDDFYTVKDYTFLCQENYIINRRKELKEISNIFLQIAGFLYLFLKCDLGRWQHCSAHRGCLRHISGFVVSSRVVTVGS